MEVSSEQVDNVVSKQINLEAKASISPMGFEFGFLTRFFKSFSFGSYRGTLGGYDRMMRQAAMPSTPSGSRFCWDARVGGVFMIRRLYGLSLGLKHLCFQRDLKPVSGLLWRPVHTSGKPGVVEKMVEGLGFRVYRVYRAYTVYRAYRVYRVYRV